MVSNRQHLLPLLFVRLLLVQVQLVKVGSYRLLLGQVRFLLVECSIRYLAICLTCLTTVLTLDIGRPTCFAYSSKDPKLSPARCC